MICFSESQRLELDSPELFQVSNIPEEIVKELPSSGYFGFHFLNISEEIGLKCVFHGSGSRFPGLSVALEFNRSDIEDGIVTREDLINIIGELVPIIRTHTSRATDTAIIKYRKMREFFQGPVRSHIIDLGWLSYFGPDLVDHLGRERFEKLQTCVEKTETNGGYLIVLQDEIFDTSNPDHLARQAKAIEELGLRDFLVPPRPKLKGTPILSGLKKKTES